MYNNSAQFTLRWRMELVFLVHWLPQRTLVPSFFFPSFFLSSIQDISGYVRCIKACAGIHGCAQVCAGVQECAGVCPAMCSYVRVYANVHVYALVCEGVWGCVWKYAEVLGCLWVFVWDEFSEYHLENRVSTSADFYTYTIQIFLNAIWNAASTQMIIF